LKSILCRDPTVAITKQNKKQVKVKHFEKTGRKLTKKNYIAVRNLFKLKQKELENISHQLQKKMAKVYERHKKSKCASIGWKRNRILFEIEKLNSMSRNANRERLIMSWRQ
jgi:hypothetical protein